MECVSLWCTSQYIPRQAEERVLERKRQSERMRGREEERAKKKDIEKVKVRWKQGEEEGLGKASFIERVRFRIN